MHITECLWVNSVDVGVATGNSIQRVMDAGHLVKFPSFNFYLLTLTLI